MTYFFLFLENMKIFLEKMKLVLDTFEILWKMEHLLQKSNCSIFHIFKNIFQRHQKALLWSKGFIKASLNPPTCICVIFFSSTKTWGTVE